MSEVIALANALNEVLGGIYIEEFETRVGLSPEFVRSLHTELVCVLNDMQEDT